MKLKIALLAGDGIGPEVTDQAVKVSKDSITKLSGYQPLLVLLLSIKEETPIQMKLTRFV